MKNFWLSLKQLIHTKRKPIHFGLLFCVIVLQLLVVLFWYIQKDTETKRSKEYEKIAELNDFSHLSGELLELLEIHQSSATTSNAEEHKASLKKLEANITAMRRLYTRYPEVKTPNSDRTLHQVFNAIQHPKSQPEFKAFDYKDITESVKVDSIITKDKIKKKGLLARLGDALSGKINVQKEQLKIIISYKSDNGIRYGTIKDQLERILKEAMAHYEDELKQSLQTGFSNNPKLQLASQNKALTELSLAFLVDYEKAISQLIRKKNTLIVEMDRKNATVQNYLIVSLIILSLLISLILYRYTHLAFKYQSRIETARKQIQENLNYKNRIISLLSHEVRSPLGSIVLYSKSVSQSVDDPEMKDTFASIQYNANSLLVLTNQILNALRNEKEVFALAPAPFHLDHEITMMCKSLIPLAENKGNQLVAEMHIPVEFQVCADQVKLGQLYFNLIGNAIRFTENGNIRVVSAIKSINNDYCWLRVYITDNGSGMHKTVLQSLLNTAYYEDTQFKINQLSTGLGIHMCREIISKMEGNFLIKSSPEKGTAIYFKIKLKRWTC